MRMRFKSILAFIIILIMGSILLGAFYFVYTNYISYGADIKISGPLSINYLDGSKLKLKGDEEVKFSIINDSQEDAYYYIEFINLKNIKGKIIYTLTNGSDVNITDELNNYNTIISSYVHIKGGEIENYTLRFDAEEEFTYRLEININTELLETNTFAEVILRNNKINNKSLTVVGVDPALEEEGLIKSVDDYGTTYYFRGKSDRNNVEINGVKFKIVRINGDGTVRLVLDGQSPELQKYYQEISNYTFKNSSIQKYLLAWASTTLEDYSSYLANHKYCYDNTFDGNESTALERLKTDNIPSFVCLGDRVLSKVGLLTADEVIYAGATLNHTNESFYLYNESVTANTYLMTSSSLTSSAYYPFMISNKGKVITNDTGAHFRSVRPVINIIKTATVTGDGTVNNPYVLTEE